MEQQIKVFDKAIAEQMELITNTLTSISESGQCSRPASLRKSVISTDSPIRPPSLNMQGLPGNSTSKVTLKRKTRA